MASMPGKDLPSDGRYRGDEGPRGLPPHLVLAAAQIGTLLAILAGIWLLVRGEVTAFIGILLLLRFLKRTAS